MWGLGSSGDREAGSACRGRKEVWGLGSSRDREAGSACRGQEGGVGLRDHD